MIAETLKSGLGCGWLQGCLEHWAGSGSSQTRVAEAWLLGWPWLGLWAALVITSVNLHE